MSPAEDSRPAIMADLQRWLRQNQGGGLPWYVDAGPVAEAVPQKAQPGKTAPTAFDIACEKFVTETLALIAAQTPAVVTAAPAETWADLQAAVQGCTACALSDSRTQTVFGAGNQQADIVFIGEAPGREEDLQGEPFVGASGQLLTKIIGAIGLSRDDVYICNILKCRPPENRDPAPAEVRHCEPFLPRQLALLRPRVICCLGRIAAQTLLQSDLSLASCAGRSIFMRAFPSWPPSTRRRCCAIRPGNGTPGKTCGNCGR